MAIRILIADDHGVVRQGLRMFLGLDPDLEVVAEAANGAEALRLVRELTPDVVLMDLLMPVMDGIAATRAIRETFPDTEVVALTSVLEDASVVGAIRAGAIGYLLKTTEAEELQRAIHAAAEGQVQLSPEAASRLMREVRAPESPETLTGRETEVLRLVAEGKANKEIAQGLGIGEKTVKTHVSNILAKLGLQSRTQAALHAARIGMVSIHQVSGRA
ncbi:MAG: response regulator [bacterium]